MHCSNFIRIRSVFLKLSRWQIVHVYFLLSAAVNGLWELHFRYAITTKILFSRSIHCANYLAIGSVFCMKFAFLCTCQRTIKDRDLISQFVVVFRKFGYTGQSAEHNAESKVRICGYWIETYLLKDCATSRLLCFGGTKSVEFSWVEVTNFGKSKIPLLFSTASRQPLVDDKWLSLFKQRWT